MTGRSLRKGEPILIDGQSDPIGQWSFVNHLRDGWVFVEIEHSGQTDGSQVEISRVEPLLRSV